MRDECDVVVVGGGMAGLACARVLDAAGLHVSVFEARARLGGRIHTVRPVGALLPVELGAEFIHGTPAESLELCAEAGIAVATAGETRWRVSPDGLRPSPWYEDDVDDVLGAMDADREPDRSVADFLAEWVRQQPERAAPAQRARGFVEGFHAADADRASEGAIAHETAASDAEGGLQSSRVPGGYDRLVHYLADQLAAATVRLNTVVHRIAWRAGRVEVEAIDEVGEPLRLIARAAVVTLPVAVLQASPGERGALRIDPPLPDKQRALSRLALGGARRIVLHFRARWWEDAALRAPGVDVNLATMGFLQADASAVPVWWTDSPLREPVLTGWLGGPRAEALAGRSDAEVCAMGLDAIAGCTGVSRARLDDLLVGAYTYDWTVDPFARGAYSYALVGAGDARRALAAPVADTLYWAGEATHADGSAGTVQGALASGYRAAGELLTARERRR